MRLFTHHPIQGVIYEKTRYLFLLFECIPFERAIFISLEYEYSG